MCPHCNEWHSLWDIREKMRGNKDLSIACKKCAKAFIPHFAVHPLHFNSKFPKQRQQEYLNPSALTDVLEEMQKTPGAQLDNAYFYHSCPVIFWNLLILFSDVRIELNHHADGEVHVYSIFDYMSKDEDSLQDSESSSERGDHPNNNRSRSKGKGTRRANFNITNFLTMHSKTAQLSHHPSNFAVFEKNSARLLVHTATSLATFGKFVTKPVVSIDISRQALKARATERRSSPGDDSRSTLVVSRSRTRSREDLGGFIGRAIAGFSTVRRAIGSGTAAVRVDLASYTQEKRRGQRAQKLINQLVTRHEVSNAKTRNRSIMVSKEPTPSYEQPCYEMCIKRQAEAATMGESKAAAARKETRDRKAQIAQQFLCRAMEILLKKVSFARDKALMEVQNYAICHRLLEGSEKAE